MNEHKIYLDNAATTAMDPLVVEAMMPYMTTHFGNPSSTYSLGVQTKIAIESARKNIAKMLGTTADTLYFTSGGTESNNTAIKCAVRDLGCTHIISSVIEHHATLHTIQHLVEKGEATVSYVRLLKDGHVDLRNLEELLEFAQGKTLVSLMHANNEIGNLLDLYKVGQLCRKYGAYFHSDTVQTVGHYPFNLKELPVDFITGAAHKFHGPKGVGLLYINKDVRIEPFIHGGAQERGMRAGTENLHGIIGLARALELATDRYEEDSTKISELRSYLKRRLAEGKLNVTFNGDEGEQALYTVLNVSFPKTTKSENLIFELDRNGICVSGGSACSSSAGGSHVIMAIDIDYLSKTPIRFSFCRNNTMEHIDKAIEALEKVLNPVAC